MNNTYFVMLKTQSGETLVPLTHDNGELAMFETRAKATEAGSTNLLGTACGFMVFDVEFEGEEY